MSTTFQVKVTKTDVSSLLALLKMRGWVKGRVLRQELNVPRRHLCAIAEASEGRVLSGNKGYRLTEDATKADLQSALGKQRAQAARTNQRMDQTERVWLTANEPF